MGLADIFGNFKNGLSNTSNKLVDLLKNPIRQETFMPTEQTNSQNFEMDKGPISDQDLDNLNKTDDRQAVMQQMGKIISKDQFKPQAYNVSPLPQLQLGQNKQYLGLSQLLKQARGL